MKKTLYAIFLLTLSLVLFLAIFTGAETQAAETPVSIALDVTEAELQKGKSLKLTATLSGDGLPKKPVLVWETSDKKVAAVQKGTVRGVSDGTAEITVSYKDEAGVIVKASCKVRVYIPISNLTVKDKTVTLAVGGSFTPKMTISPKNASNKALLWKSSNEKIATVSERGQVRGVNSGECTITATSQDGSNKSVSFNVFVPTLYTSTKEVVFDNMTAFFSPITFHVNYTSNQRNITLDDKDARNNWFFPKFKDGVLTIRMWPWMPGTSTLTISDSTSPKSTIKIKIKTTSESGLRSFENLTKSDYQDYMRYGFSEYGEIGWYIKARIMQVENGSKTTWALAYSRGKYDDLIYFEYPSSKEEKHDWFKDSSIRMQEDDIIQIWGMPIGIYDYKTTSGSMNHALQIEPMIMAFDDGTLFFVNKDILD